MLCDGCADVGSCWPGTGGGAVLIERGVSAVGVCADLLCIDISSSDSDPGPGERGVAVAGGGGGGTGRDSDGGGRLLGWPPGTGGAPIDNGRSVKN